MPTAADVALATADPEQVAVAFARVLRGCGVDAPIHSVVTFAQALAAVGLDRRDDVYWAGRTTLIRRPETTALYDRAFRVFWEHASADAALDEETIDTITLAVDVDEDGEEEDDDGPDRAEASEDPVVELRFSATEVLRAKDFGAYDDDELAEAHRLMARMRFAGSPRRSMRLAAAPTGQPDLRRTVRSALHTDGEAIRRYHRDAATKHRRVVLILDVSGSMEPYARALLRFVQAAVSGRSRVEAFALGTRLTRITRELDARDPDRALRQAAARVTDWSGGTRLGDGFRRFNDEWGIRGMARGADVVILSDGWDRGDPDVLAEQLARLGRVAHRIIWVNPLKVTPGYAPLARGMAAALPHVDHFVEGHSLDAVERLAAVLDEG